MSHRPPVLLRRTTTIATTLVAVAVAALGLGLGSGVGSTAPASAADVGGAITAVSLTPTDPAEGSQLTTDISWRVPDGAQPGDTFSLRLSDHMENLPGDFGLDDPATGARVADAVVAQDRPYIVEFTLTDYVATHHAVSGTAFVRADFDGVAVPSGQPTDFTATTNDGASFTTTITPTGPVYGNGAYPSKYGEWTTADRGHTDPVDAVAWNVDTPFGPFTSA